MGLPAPPKKTLPAPKVGLPEEMYYTFPALSLRRGDNGYKRFPAKFGATIASLWAHICIRDFARALFGGVVAIEISERSSGEGQLGSMAVAPPPWLSTLKAPHRHLGERKRTKRTGRGFKRPLHIHLVRTATQ